MLRSHWDNHGTLLRSWLTSRSNPLALFQVHNPQKGSNLTHIIRRRDAVALGLARYFTGKSCVNGHVSERLTHSRKCVGCHAFYYHRNPAQCIERHKLWRTRNKEKFNQTRKKRYASDVKYSTAIRAKNRAWRAARREEQNARISKWRRNNKAWSVAWRHNRRSAEGHFTGPDIIRIRKAQRGRCALCRCKLRGRGHVDHIKAIARGGTNWPRNIQLTCGPCNSRKGTTDPITYAQRIGLLL